MAAVMTDSLAEVPTTPNEGDHLAQLREDMAFAAAADPELERWIATARRQADVSCVALSLTHGPRQIIRLVGEARGMTERVREVSSAIPLEDYLLGAAPPGDGRGAFAEVPITVTGKLVGQLAMTDPMRASWSADDLAALSDAAAGVATELERRLACAQVVRVQELVTSHNRVHDMIGNGAALRDVLIEVCLIIERYDPSFIPSVLLRDPVSNTLHSGIGPSLPKAYLDSVDGAPIGPNIGTCGPAAWFGELAISADLRQDPKWTPIRAMAEMAGVAHCWSMPIKEHSGEVLGTLALYGRRPRSPQPEHVALMRDWARVASTALERTRSIERLRHDARHDSLTGLPNRAAIFEKLDAAIEQVQAETPLAVFFVDLDGLKALNDTLGHDVADEMIREVAQRLLASVRIGDFVGRFGGDEFIVVAEDIGDPTGSRPPGRAAAGCDRATAARSWRAGHHGQHRHCPDPHQRASKRAKPSAGPMPRCMRPSAPAAIAACSRKSAKPPGPVVAWSWPERCTAPKRVARCRLVYQPVIALPSRKVIGVEALLRWNSPTLGEVLPSEFIPIAEDNGTILQLGAWVLWESCAALATLAQAGHRLELGVNVSARQLSQPDFPLWVRQTLAHAQFSPAMLSLELTETSLLRPDSVSVGNVRTLEKMGVRVALDDFGTGYSSLTWLRDHPFGSIKIDRSFVAGIQKQDSSRAIVAAIIRMAKDVGCTVTAEGVETEEQLQVLESLGCDHAQGYLIARPISASALLSSLNTPVSLPT